MSGKCPTCGQDIPERCGRCGNFLKLHWTDTHSNGKIFVDHPSMASEALTRGARYLAEMNPLVTILEGQRIQLEWGTKTEYKLCRLCSEHLLQVLGSFFRLQEEEDLTMFTR